MQFFQQLKHKWLATYCFNQLPRLVIDADNVSGIFGKWFKKYLLAARLAEINMGIEKDEKSNVVL